MSLFGAKCCPKFFSQNVTTRVSRNSCLRTLTWSVALFWTNGCAPVSQFACMPILFLASHETGVHQRSASQVALYLQVVMCIDLELI